MIKIRGVREGQWLIVVGLRQQFEFSEQLPKFTLI